MSYYPNTYFQPGQLCVLLNVWRGKEVQPRLQ